MSALKKRRRIGERSVCGSFVIQSDITRTVIPPDALFVQILNAIAACFIYATIPRVGIKYLMEIYFCVMFFLQRPLEQHCVTRRDVIQT